MPSHHLIQQHTKGPPVHTRAVGLVVDDLRGDVLWSPAKCPGARPRLYTNLNSCCLKGSNAGTCRHLAEPEVCYLDVPLLVEHHVVQLEVPVEDPVLVQIQQGDADLCCIKSAERGEADS